MLRRVSPVKRDTQIVSPKDAVIQLFKADGSKEILTETQIERVQRVLSFIERYTIVIGEAAETLMFQRIDLCISARGMDQIRLLDKKESLRIYGDSIRGSVNTVVPIYLWGDGEGPSRYLRLAMGDTGSQTLFGVRMRSVPGEPAKPVKE